METTRRLCRLLQIFNGQIKNGNFDDNDEDNVVVDDANSSNFKALLKTDLSNSFLLRVLSVKCLVI